MKFTHFLSGTFGYRGHFYCQPKIAVLWATFDICAKPMDVNPSHASNLSCSLSNNSNTQSSQTFLKISIISDQKFTCPMELKIGTEQSVPYSHQCYNNFLHHTYLRTSSSWHQCALTSQSPSEVKFGFEIVQKIKFVLYTVSN